MNTNLLKRIKAEERRLMKKKTRRVRRQVLGIGYPLFGKKKGTFGFVDVRLVTNPNDRERYNERGIIFLSEDVVLKIGDLGAYQKIKLIAEYVK